MAALRSRFPVVVVLGATGTGKSKLAIELAKVFSGEIINADSMQAYKGLDIITNKVTAEERAECPHHLLDFVSPLNFKYTIADFQAASIPIIENLLSNQKLPVIVGGTNYYIESLLWKFLIKKEEHPESTGNDSARNVTSEKVPFSLKCEAETVDNKDKELLAHISTDSGTPKYIPTECSPIPKRRKLNAEHGNESSRDDSTVTHKSEIDSTTQLVKTEGKNVDGDSSDSESSHSDRTELKSSCTDNTDVNNTVSDTHKEYCTKETTNISECDITSFPLCDIRQWGYEVDSVQLHARLKQLDPTSAQKIHPNDRRKLIRALEIYDKHGIPKSEILKEQHKSVGLDAISGPLRYPKSCIFWIQCDQEVLNERLDKRVDDMLQRGLVSELLDFHKQYNESRIKEGIELDYTLGIFQSIGFKEFHEYLIMSEEERNTKKGDQLFNEGVEALKRVTRKYARKQVRWLNNRLLKRSPDNTPPVYALDATDVTHWQNKVHNPAVEVLQAMMKDELPAIPTAPHLQEPKNKHVLNVCDICDGIILVTEKDFKMHMASRKHKKNLARKKALELKNQEIEKEKQRDVIEEENH
ncbi:tRNA dimethylallyltransferase-like isoform X1 [Octopus vulgaris]|uniref:tRNA dimethylallyltransferase-like isoform X1 n=1 Tax=Octopus vulgaris TaxID=6645 RepID=A0AA36B5Q7_OCTVU|nr:tRNA dimethylallyltransferase-like isoform X1 [Octopus vulgaris]